MTIQPCEGLCQNILGGCLLAQAWIQKYDHALGDTLEPEEADSDSDPECLLSDDETRPKRRRQAPPQPQDGYPEHLWPALVQGEHGFNAEARKVLQAMLPDGAHAWSSPTQGQVKLLKQQAVASLLVHPKSPVSRILLDHNTGSGKTLCMLRILDNYYFSLKPKIVVVPKDTVMWNLYATLWQFPSRWRDFASHQCPKAAELACGALDWRSRRHLQWPLMSEALRAAAAREGLTLQKAIKSLLLQKMRDCLEMKRAFYNGRVRKAYVDKHLGSDFRASQTIRNADLQSQLKQTGDQGASFLGIDVCWGPAKSPYQPQITPARGPKQSEG